MICLIILYLRCPWYESFFTKKSLSFFVYDLIKEHTSLFTQKCDALMEREEELLIIEFNKFR